ncbi:MAG: hypothetical protein ACYDBB_24735 [Armatimonadota bacterium]
MAEKPWYRRRWLRVACVLALAAVAGYGIYWWCSPASVRLVARVPGGNPVACVAGCLVHTGGIAATLVDWRTGKPIWRVPEPSPKRMMTRVGDTTRTSISPDGHTYAAAEVRSGRLRLFIWRDGTLTTDLLLPSLKDNTNVGDPLAGVQALDSGRVFCWQSGYDGLHIYQAAQGRLIARGFLPCHTNRERVPDPGWYRTASTVNMAPDGRLLSFYECLPIISNQPEPRRIYCWTLTVSGTTIHGARLPKVPGSVEAVLLDGGGGYYLDHSRMSISPVAVTAGVPMLRGSYNCANGAAIILADNADLHVVVPAARSQWTFPHPRSLTSLGGMAVTPDGRFAVGYAARPTDPYHYPPPIPWLLDRTNLSIPGKAWIIVIERPGVIRAMLPVRTLKQWEGTPKLDCDSRWCLISPDGHGLVTDNTYMHECVLMRW